MKYAGIVVVLLGLVFYALAFGSLMMAVPPFGLTPDKFADIKNALMVGGLFLTVYGGIVLGTNKYLSAACSFRN